MKKYFLNSSGFDIYFYTYFYLPMKFVNLKVTFFF